MTSGSGWASSRHGAHRGARATVDPSIPLDRDCLRLRGWASSALRTSSGRLCHQVPGGSGEDGYRRFRWRCQARGRPSRARRWSGGSCWASTRARGGAVGNARMIRPGAVAQIRRRCRPDDSGRDPPHCQPVASGRSSPSPHAPAWRAMLPPRFKWRRPPSVGRAARAVGGGRHAVYHDVDAGGRSGLHGARQGRLQVFRSFHEFAMTSERCRQLIVA